MFTHLNELYTRMGAQGMTLNILVALSVTIFVFGIIIVIGRIIDELETFTLNKLVAVCGVNVANLICNYLTFPGVMVHELAHCLFVIIFGGKVTKCKLFEFNGRGRLGHVEYITRGSKTRQALQLMFGSAAPTICGLFELYIIYRAFELGASNVFEGVVLAYFAFCIAIHMSMSDEDMKGYLKGVIYAFPVLFGLNFAIQFFLAR